MLYRKVLSTLLLGFSLYFTINGFFFSDETMNKVNEDKGAFNFLAEYNAREGEKKIINSIVLNLSSKVMKIDIGKTDDGFCMKFGKGDNNSFTVKYTAYFDKYGNFITQE